MPKMGNPKHCGAVPRRARCRRKSLRHPTLLVLDITRPSKRTASNIRWLAGVADGAGVELSLLQALHAVPLLMPYSCSSIAVWGDATVDGHLYQSRNLDWSLEVGAHNIPLIIVYLPDDGIPHVVPTFAGMIGAHTGLNIRGIALSEMGDASQKDAPYLVHATHFTTFFRTMLYDGQAALRTLGPANFGCGPRRKSRSKSVAREEGPSSMSRLAIIRSDISAEATPRLFLEVRVTAAEC